MLRHRFVIEPKSELMSRKGSMLPLISILDALISRIYALPQGLLERPKVPLLGSDGFKFELISIALNVQLPLSSIALKLLSNTLVLVGGRPCNEEVNTLLV